MCTDPLLRESARHHRERAWRRMEGIPVRRVTGAIGLYNAAHVIHFNEDIGVWNLRCPQLGSGERYPGRICSAARTAVHGRIAVSLLLLPHIENAVFIAILNR